MYSGSTDRFRNDEVLSGEIAAGITMIGEYRDAWKVRVSMV